MRPADIVFEGVYRGNDERNTRRVTALFEYNGHPAVEYEPTGDRKPQAFLLRDGRAKMTLSAFARWAKGRVS